MTIEKVDSLYEGKAKIVYSTSDPDKVIFYFKDDATAFNAKKKGTIEQKGVCNCDITSRIFSYLETKGIPTHFLEKVSDREMLCRRLDIIPIEVVARNRVAGSLSERFGVEEGTPLTEPVFEFYYKSDLLGDPMINRSHIRAFNLAAEDEVDTCLELARKINEILIGFFDRRDIILVDFKLEFGRHHGEVFLGDEISPDGCRLWDKLTSRKLDKDRFRRDLGSIEEAYAEVHRRVFLELEEDK